MQQLTVADGGVSGKPDRFRRLPITGEIFRWMKANLFSSPANTLLTLIATAIIYFTLVPLFEWLILDAYWFGTKADDCQNKTAACWPFIWSRLDQFIYGFYPISERWRINLGIGIALVLITLLFVPKIANKKWILIGLVFIYPCVAAVLFYGGWFGIARVPTHQWGGFFLTIVVSVLVLSLSLPFGILLALGRRSDMAMIRVFCAGWIELWRSIPALALLFIVIIMFPLFMPKGYDIDKLLRAMIALNILMSCYLAEAIRGALQNLPKGQYEAAAALGLGYWRSTLLVILPQAMRSALPQITSIFIGLFKETTILLVIGLYDLLGVVQLASADPQWLSTGVSATGYFFAGFFFWCFCFAMSRYSSHLEGKMKQATDRN